MKWQSKQVKMICAFRVKLPGKRLGLSQMSSEGRLIALCPIVLLWFRGGNNHPLICREDAAPGLLSSLTRWGFYFDSHSRSRMLACLVCLTVDCVCKGIVECYFQMSIVFFFQKSLCFQSLLWMELFHLSIIFVCFGVHPNTMCWTMPHATWTMYGKEC